MIKKELKQIPANRRLVEELYSHGEIEKKTKDYTLNFLYPHKQWGLWISHFLLIFGTALLLSGIIYFFAFNWAKIPPIAKLTAIQIGIISCIVGAYFYSLQGIGGLLLLFSASILIGVFMAVFGQIYQTGADAYQLFMMWSLFIFGWTVLSKFSAQWVLWLVITNIFIILWWIQSGSHLTLLGVGDSMIFTYLTLFNGTALALCEYLSKKNSYEWLNARWAKILLTIAVLITMMISICVWIADLKAPISIIISSVIGLIGHGLIYFFYRYKRPDILALACWTLSVCIITEFIIFKILSKMDDTAGALLLGGILTLCVFTCAVIYLQKVSKKTEIKND